MMNKEYILYTKILLLACSLVLFSQLIVSLSNHDAKITVYTLLGLTFMILFSLIGLKIGEKIKNFPVLGWVSLTSLFFCLPFWPFSELIIKSISSVNFLSMTTPILAVAGISVANKMDQLKDISWRIVIVGMGVFIGTYLFSATIAQLFL